MIIKDLGGSWNQSVLKKTSQRSPTPQKTQTQPKNKNTPPPPRQLPQNPNNPSQNQTQNVFYVES